MNGRIYDPRLGRFLQADPIVQAPKYSQSLNRYTYVFNNPLSYTDPSGYEGFLVASVISSFFAFIADRFNRPEDQAISTKPSEYLKQNSVPGALSNAFGDQTGRIDKKQFTNIDVKSATVGGTASEETGRKFANGAQLEAFAKAHESTLESEGSSHLPEMFKDKKFRVVLDRAISRTTKAVRQELNDSGTQRSLGVTIKPDSEQGFEIAPHPNNVPNTAVLDGLEQKSGRIFGGFAGELTPIEDAAAVVIARPTFERNNSILASSKEYQKLSNQLNAPVVVVSSGGRSKIFVFSGNNQPATYPPRN